jgi:hypothetical protein
MVVLLFGCSGTQKDVRTDLLVKSTELLPPDISAMKAKPNSVIVKPRWLEEEKLSVDFLAYKIDAEPVFGLAVNIIYDSEVLNYLSYEKGNFLEHGGKPIGKQKPMYLISTTEGKTKEKKSREEKLIIGATLFRGTPGVTGTGKLFNLLFNIRKDTPTEIKFTKKKLKNLQAKDITQINWPDSISISRVSK